MNEEMKQVIEQAIRQYGGEEITEAQHKGWIMEIDLMLYQTRIQQFQMLVDYFRGQADYYRSLMNQEEPADTPVDCDAKLTQAERMILEHALTGGRDHVYRNHYAAYEGTKEYDILMGLKLRGFVKKMRAPSRGPVTFFVTGAGAGAVGLKLPVP